MAYSVNKVILIGNLTRDPELRMTSGGKQVCTIGLATNRSWTTDSGERKEETQFHRIVVWGKLADLCSKLLATGSLAYFEGRLSIREHMNSKGEQVKTTEIIADNMLALAGRREKAVEENNNEGNLK